jgi:hypothetical protein
MLMEVIRALGAISLEKQGRAGLNRADYQH